MKFQSKQKSGFKAMPVLLSGGSVSKKDIIIKERKDCLPEENTQEKSPKDMSFYESFDFSEGDIWVATTAFSLNRLYSGRIFLTEFGGTFLCRLFCRCLFSYAKEKIHREKNPTETSSELNENSSKVRRNTSPQECWKN